MANDVIPATQHHRTHVTGQPLCPAEVHALERLVRQVTRQQPRAQAEEPRGEGHRAQDADGEHAEARRGVEVPVSSGLGRLGASCSQAGLSLEMQEGSRSITVLSLSPKGLPWD